MEHPQVANSNNNLAFGSVIITTLHNSNVYMNDAIFYVNNLKNIYFDKKVDFIVLFNENFFCQDIKLSYIRFCPKRQNCSGQLTWVN